MVIPLQLTNKNHYMQLIWLTLFRPNQSEMKMKIIPLQKRFNFQFDEAESFFDRYSHVISEDHMSF